MRFRSEGVQPISFPRTACFSETRQVGPDRPRTKGAQTMADTSNIRDKAKDTATAAGHAAQEAKGLAQETAPALSQKAGEVASNLGHKAQDTASNLGHRAQDMASRAGDRAEDAISSVGQGMSHLAGTLRQKAPHEGRLGSAAGTVADRLE